MPSSDQPTPDREHFPWCEVQADSPLEASCTCRHQPEQTERWAIVAGVRDGLRETQAKIGSRPDGLGAAVWALVRTAADELDRALDSYLLSNDHPTPESEGEQRYATDRTEEALRERIAEADEQINSLYARAIAAERRAAEAERERDQWRRAANGDRDGVLTYESHLRTLRAVAAEKKAAEARLTEALDALREAADALGKAANRSKGVQRAIFARKEAKARSTLTKLEGGRDAAERPIQVLEGALRENLPVVEEYVRMRGKLVVTRNRFPEIIARGEAEAAVSNLRAALAKLEGKGR